MVARIVLPIVALLLLATSTHAAPLQRADVPEPLRPWIDWVLRGHEDQRCAAFQGDNERRLCAWPARLELALDERGGRFVQTWEMQREGWVDLPGDAAHAPQDVTLDGTAAVLVVQGGIARVHLDRGRHVLSGRFTWDRLPEALPIPAATGLLELTLAGEPVPFPNRDADGRLWLQRRDATAEADDHLDLLVQRAVVDGVPLQLVSRLRLDVAGKGREITLGPVLPAGFTPMAIDSALPARLEADGRLRLQVRAGRWAIEIRARHEGPAAALTAPGIDPPPSMAEVWVFEAQPALRLVSVEGVDSIDPQQTELAEGWRQLPAYRMRPGDTMRLVERRRGAEPTADELTLQRTLWLDFDGGGYSVRDVVAGTLASATHLDMAPPTALGRVAVGGVDQFITRLADGAPAGVELRPGPLDLNADCRIEGVTRDLPAVSWEHDFQGLSGQLQLPPGWRLLHATGVDQAYPTWIATWTLLDLFVVLIIALAVARLFGWTWGAVTLAAVGLSYTEPGAPGWIWIAVLTAEALTRVVPPGRWLLFVRFARIAALAGLAVVVVAFAIGQIRRGVYPSLEHPYGVMAAGDLAAAAAPAAPLEEGFEQRDALVADRVMRKAAGEPDDAPGSRRVLSDVDPRAIVQTGPGMPSWTWNAVSLTWSGPVQRDQRLYLLLIPPWLNLVLAIARTLLLAAVVVMLVRGWRWLRRAPHGAAAALLAIALAAAPARADVPPAEMLDELRTRLLEPADCRPNCASYPRLRLEVDARGVRARLAVDVAAATAVPLPGQATQWLPRSVVVDGEATHALSQGADGVLWLYLEAGRHDVALEGPLPARDTVQIPLPLVPLRVEAQVDGWTLDGLHENGVADPSLQLNRTAPAAGASAAPLRTDQLPAFARVERTLLLSLTWQVQTSVMRLTPADAALVLEVPLLPGEAVTTAGVRVVDGKVQINLPPQVGATGWESTLPERSPIALAAPTAVSWVEVWRLDASTMWHVETSGLAPLHRANVDAAPLEWRPWPGESLALTVTRPQGVEGQTLTIDRSHLLINPGLRATDATLELALRSSRGAQHTLTLPDGAALQSVTIDGSVQPITQEGRQVVLPLRPAAQGVELRWRVDHGIEAMLRTPEVDVGAPSVNAHLQVSMPANRWILLAGGPRLGPAVLFWSILPVLPLVSLGLGRVRLTPLRAHHWFLLGIGLTQVEVGLAVIVVGWLLALGWRRARGAELGAVGFDLLQVSLAAWTVVALAVLVGAIQRGLLGTPDMQIAGNGSSAEALHWYADRAAAALPRAWVLSVPLLVYRLLMLAWALWLAQALLRWLTWAWQTFGSGGFWRPLRRRRPAAA